ncbi:type II secretion system protein M [Alginatibacterium sediminis]|uniref:Type II secretion system protein M n=1 Tax=Alginatibacterium sediminis TaxID=2164068 RepID=A0A420E665_9ALTE|nr:type II secretion system protein M [Alginatibacterium sediminis]RKF13190.1 type II secretion system protein M [Alginatibacterium sediminis]
MKQWWVQLQKREQQLLIVASMFAFFALVYWGIWQPLSSQKANLSQRLQTQQVLLDWALDNRDRLKQAPQQADGSFDNLNQLVSSTARANAITITRLLPKENQVELWIDAVRFESLLTWLEQLKKNHGVSTLLLEVEEIEQRSAWVKVRRLKLGESQ